MKILNKMPCKKNVGFILDFLTLRIVYEKLYSMYQLKNVIYSLFS